MDQPDDMEIDDRSNGGGFEKIEVREGMPLDYVAEKAYKTLLGLHRLHEQLYKKAKKSSLFLEEVSDNVSYAVRFKNEEHPLRICALTFDSALTTFLALKNMLALKHDEDIVEKLLFKSSTEFRQWLKGVNEQGSVSESS